MGLEHGAYCLGCCWFVMALLFFGGIMNLFWIAGLALFVLSEKTISMGHWFSRIAGVCFAAWGDTSCSQRRERRSEKCGPAEL